MKIKNSLNNSPLIKPGANFYFDQYEVSKYNEIKDKLISSDCSQMWDNQREFLNGLVRKFKPKKILEIGVFRGGSSIVLLNAIEDFKDSHLYSIDLDSRQEVGYCVNKYFPNLSKKWTLFKGKIATEYLEEIGDNIDMVLIDTAGRLQNKSNLMDELAKINRVIKKVIPEAPHETLLVIDATTGQNGINQAKSFKEITDISGIVLTKLDGTAKGGIVLAIKDEVNIPVKFVGLGEKMTDLKTFDIENYIYGLFKDMM
jgi:hypothetical protein